MKKRITSIVLVLIMVLSLCPVAMAEEVEEYANRLYTLEQFIYAIGTNNLDPVEEGDSYSFTDWNQVEGEDKETLEIGLKNGIIRGDGDTIRPYDNVLRIEAFVMLSRALDNLEMTSEPLVFSDTPDWAKADIDRLSAAGLVKGTEPGLLGADDYITKEQVHILADRIDSVITETTLEDDYYNTVNAKWIRNNTIPPAYASWSTLNEVDKKATDAAKDIILNDYAAAPQGSTRANVYNYYLSVLDSEKRNADGVSPIKPYLDMLDAARTTDDLVEIMGNIAKDNSMFSLMALSIGPDELNTDEMLLTLSSADVGIGAYYLLTDEQAVKEYTEYLLTLFKLAGEEERGLEDRIDLVVSFQTLLAEYGLGYDEYMEFENRYNEYTMEKFNNEFYNINLKLYFDTMGIPVPDRFIVEEIRQMHVINSFMEKENIEIIKDFIKAILLKDSAPFLSDDFVDANTKLDSYFFEVEGELDPVDNAIIVTNSAWDMVIGSDYMKKHYPVETTRDVEKMTQEIIDVYKGRINNLEWLSDDTKKNAIKKLDNLTIKVGGPESYPVYFDDIEITPPEKGGSLFANMAKISAAGFKDGIETLSTDYDRSQWFVPPHMVNAFYYPLTNEIILPAGILQEPLYSPDYSYEQNLGGIGSIIAHEISHAFDSTGAQYDEKGNYKNWWTEQDYAKFEELSQDIAYRFSQIEVVDGYFVDGDYTLNENIADLGAISCIIEVASKHEGFDYDLMFRSYAGTWTEIVPDKNVITQLINDNHAPAKVRVNGVLQNFEKFYETYGIEKDDGMYLPEEDRVGIW